MGDLSAEPSMEDILSSIKRIIAEEGDGHPRSRRPQRPIAPPSPIEEDDQILGGYTDDDVDGADAGEAILELSDPMPDPDPAPAAPPQPRSRAQASRGSDKPAAPAPTPAPTAESILSQETAAASRGSLATLSKLLVKPEAGSDGTLEGLVREMLRPMLREWLDANLPDLVESMVAREIEKITGQAQ